MHCALKYQKIKKVNWCGHFSVFPEVPISFALAIWPDYIVIMLLCEVHQSSAQRTWYLPSLSQYQFIHLGQEKQVRVKFLAQGHIMPLTQGSSSRPWDHDSRTLPLSYACLLNIKRNITIELLPGTRDETEPMPAIVTLARTVSVVHVAHDYLVNITLPYRLVGESGLQPYWRSWTPFVLSY